MTLEKMLSDRFKARMALGKVSSPEEREALMAQIVELTEKIGKIRGPHRG